MCCKPLLCVCVFFYVLFRFFVSFSGSLFSCLIFWFCLGFFAYALSCWSALSFGSANERFYYLIILFWCPKSLRFISLVLVVSSFLVSLLRYVVVWLSLFSCVIVSLVP